MLDPMPLIKGGSRAAIGENIKREMRSGSPRKQAEAIALGTARRSGADIPKPKPTAQRIREAAARERATDRRKR